MRYGTRPALLTIVSKPDVVHHLPDGTREETFFRKSPGQPGHQSQVRKIIGADGLTRELWHEVLDPSGNVIHQDCKFNREDEDAADVG
jgi:hypothetical protein